MKNIVKKNSKTKNQNFVETMEKNILHNSHPSLKTLILKKEKEKEEAKSITQI